MADNKDNNEPNPADTGAETDAEKAAREQREREHNEAEKKVRGWVQDELKKTLPETVKGLLPKGISSQGSPGKKSVLDQILGR